MADAVAAFFFFLAFFSPLTKISLVNSSRRDLKTQLYHTPHMTICVCVYVCVHCVHKTVYNHWAWGNVTACVSQKDQLSFFLLVFLSLFQFFFPRLLSWCLLCAMSCVFFLSFYVFVFFISVFYNLSELVISIDFSFCPSAFFLFYCHFLVSFGFSRFPSTEAN